MVYGTVAALLWHATTIRSGEGHKGNSSDSWSNHVSSLDSSFWLANFAPESCSYDASCKSGIKGKVMQKVRIHIVACPTFGIKRGCKEKTLQELLKKQRSVVEDIKKKTNYYSTQELLSKYDTSPVNSPLRQRVVPMPIQPTTPQRRQATPITPRAPAPPTLQPHLPGTSSLVAHRCYQPVSSILAPPSPFMPRKQWYDKVADVLLGDEDSNVTNSRYALICEKCRAHNGLVKESLWDDTGQYFVTFQQQFHQSINVEYICPKCNHFNPAPRSKRTPMPSRDTSPQPPSQSSSPDPSIGRAAQAAQSRTTSPSQRGDAGLMEVDS